MNPPHTDRQFPVNPRFGRLFSLFSSVRLSDSSQLQPDVPALRLTSGVYNEDDVIYKQGSPLTHISHQHSPQGEEVYHVTPR